MNRKEWEVYIIDNYSAEMDYPWEEYPGYQVFRHPLNKKWFALAMGIPAVKLGIEENEWIPIMNLKCNPILIGSFRNDVGFFPAYHMNKENWLTVRLDGVVEKEKIEMLIEMSYESTRPKRIVQKK